MGWGDFAYLARSDLFRYTGKANLYLFLKSILFNPGFKYTFFMRLCRYSQGKIFLLPAHIFAKLLYLHYTCSLGISIPFNTEIGAGFYIGHFGCIVISDHVKIGSNCNISHGVTIGKANRGKKKGCPVIGNKVYIGPGAKVIGSIKVGNNVAIGANCVVVDDIPDNSVVVGVPGRVVSNKGIEDYVDNTI